MIQRHNTLPKAQAKDKKGRGMFKRPTAVRLLSGNTVTADKTNWKTFYSSCKSLSNGMRKFSAAIEHLTESRDVDTGRECRLSIGKLIITVTVRI